MLNVLAQTGAGEMLEGLVLSEVVLTFKDEHLVLLEVVHQQPGRSILRWGLRCAVSAAALRERTATVAVVVARVPSTTVPTPSPTPFSLLRIGSGVEGFPKFLDLLFEGPKLFRQV